MSCTWLSSSHADCTVYSTVFEEVAACTSVKRHNCVFNLRQEGVWLNKRPSLVARKQELWVYSATSHSDSLILSGDTTIAVWLWWQSDRHKGTSLTAGLVPDRMGIILYSVEQFNRQIKLWKLHTKVGCTVGTQKKNTSFAISMKDKSRMCLKMLHLATLAR